MSGSIKWERVWKENRIRQIKAVVTWTVLWMAVLVFIVNGMRSFFRVTSC